MEAPFDYLNFIGRMSPPHKGHLSVLRQALRMARHLIVFIGSSHRARSSKNPWTGDEREAMVRSMLSEEESARVSIVQLPDHLHLEPVWLARIERETAAICRQRGEDPDQCRIGIIGCNKDRSSYYLKQFPSWELALVGHTGSLSATEIRQHLFSGAPGDFALIRANVAPGVASILEAWHARSSAFPVMRDEDLAIKAKQAPYAGLPYPPHFVTADVAVSCKGRVLLIQRTEHPGKGLWALPGAYMHDHEILQATALRALREKAGLALSLEDFHGALRGVEVFDDVTRSTVGRVVSSTFVLELEKEEHLPEVLSPSKWVTRVALEEMSEQMFEDHYDILEKLIGIRAP